MFKIKTISFQNLTNSIEPQQVKMIDDSKRSLRARKNPKYLNSDVYILIIQQQDPDKVSFSQLKSHHDYSSSHNQKTQDAKILVKLINKINKNYKTYLNQISNNAMQVQKPEPLPKDKKSQIQLQTTKKQTSITKQNKKQSQQKSKPLYNIKNQPSSKQQQTLKNTQAYINQLKQMGSIPNVPGIGKGLFTDQLKKLQTLYPDMKNISYQTLTQNTNPNLFAGSLTNIQKRKQPQQKNLFSQEKLFKRSAYHVAIAYHIYLKNLKQKGGVIGNQIDPTYHAKRLKQGRPLE